MIGFGQKFAELVRGVCDWREFHYVRAPLIDGLVVAASTASAALAAVGEYPFEEPSGWWAGGLGAIGPVYALLKHPLHRLGHRDDLTPGGLSRSISRLGCDELAQGRLTRVVNATRLWRESAGAGLSGADTMKALYVPSRTLEEVVNNLQAALRAELLTESRQCHLRVLLASVKDDLIEEILVCTPLVPNDILSVEQLNSDRSGFRQCLRLGKPRYWDDVKRAVAEGELLPSDEFLRKGGSLYCVPFENPESGEHVLALSVFVAKKGCIARASEGRLEWLAERAGTELVAQQLLKNLMEASDDA